MKPGRAALPTVSHRPPADVEPSGPHALVHALRAATLYEQSVCCACSALHIGIDVTTDPDGLVAASVHVSGALCGSTAPDLVRAIDDLLELGASQVDVNLDDAAPCIGEGRERSGVPAHHENHS